MRTNYVLIDYENVQPEALSGLDAEHFKKKNLLSSELQARGHIVVNQTKVSYALLEGEA